MYLGNSYLAGAWWTMGDSRTRPTSAILAVLLFLLVSLPEMAHAQGRAIFTLDWETADKPIAIDPRRAQAQGDGSVVGVLGLTNAYEIFYAIRVETTQGSVEGSKLLRASWFPVAPNSRIDLTPFKFASEGTRVRIVAEKFPSDTPHLWAVMGLNLVQAISLAATGQSVPTKSQDVVDYLIRAIGGVVETPWFATAMAGYQAGRGDPVGTISSLAKAVSNSESAQDTIKDILRQVVSASISRAAVASAASLLSNARAVRNLNSLVRFFTHLGAAPLVGIATIAVQKFGTVTSSGLYLPWSKELGRVRCSQGPGGSPTHRPGSWLEHSWDFLLTEGTPVLASKAGVVVKVRSTVTETFPIGTRNTGKDFGNFVVIDHKDGTFAVYAHLLHDGILKKEGDEVSRGEPIAYSGNTGVSSGPHLHFHVQSKGIAPSSAGGNTTLLASFVEGDPKCPGDLVSANEPPTVLTQTIVVIDRSNSMNEILSDGPKIEIVKRAAAGLVDMLKREVQVAGKRQETGLISFNQSAALDQSLTSDAEVLRGEIARIEASGNTNIGDALQLALRELPASANNPQIIVLLSDGKITAGPSTGEVLAGPVAEAASRNIRIYTIGFNEGEYLDEGFLKEVAARTGAEYFTARDAYRLENVYLAIYHQATGQIAGQYSGQVAQGVTVTAGEFTVSGGVPYLRVSLNWPGSRLGLGLIDPSGKPVGQDYPGADLSVDIRPASAFVYQPMPGRWRAQVTGLDVSGSEPFELLVSIPRPPASSGAGVIWVGLLVVLAVASGAVLLIGTKPRGGVPSRSRGPIEAIVVSSGGPRIQILSSQWEQVSAEYGGRFEMRRLGGGAELRAVSTRGVRTTRVRPGQAVGLDGYQILIWDSSRPVAWLQRMDDGRLMPLFRSVTSIGTAGGNAVRLQGAGTFSRHATLTRKAGSLTLRDLSKGHTYVNGYQVDTSNLESGQRVSFGNETFIVKLIY